ncbi:MAG: flavoprotein [Polyangiales bacterium]
MSGLRRVEPLCAWDEGDDTLVLVGRTTLRFEGDSAALARTVLALLVTPRTRAALLHAIAGEVGAPLSADEAAVVDALVDTLRRHGAVTETPAPQGDLRVGRNVLVAVSGAVAAVDAPALVRLLQASGHAVRVAMTSSARRFVSARALAALTHAPVHRSLWSGRATEPAPHIALARWADVVAVYPCTASTLARLAAGDAADLVSATVCATAAPVLLAPSMNHAMLTAPAVQENLARLRARGVRVAHAAVGLEVADDPAHRDEMLGPAMAPAAFARIVDAVTASLPLRAHDWETLYRRDLPRPWEVPHDLALDELLRMFAPAESHPRMLELGCGLGEHAIARTHAGWSVTALDVSARAIAHAAARESVVTWVCDDVTRTRLHGRFDVVVDRGCFHTLDAAGRARCAAQVARWLRPEGVWVLKVHAEGGPDVGTARFSADALDGAVGEGFVRGALRAMDFGGSAAQPALAAAYVRR